MAAVPVTSSAKPSFENLVSGIPDVLPRELGQICEDRTALLNPTFAELPSILSRALRCDVKQLRERLGLPPRQESGGTSAADGDKKKQIHHLLLELVEQKATLKVLLEALYVEDEETAIQKVAEGIKNPDSERAMPAPKKVTFEPVDSMSSVPSLQKQPQDFHGSEEAQNVLPKDAEVLNRDTEAASENLDSHSEHPPLEPRVDLPLQKEPLKESSNHKNTRQHTAQSNKDRVLDSKELQKFMEESQPGGGTSSVMATSHVPRALDPGSHDPRMYRMEVKMEGLQQYVERAVEELSLRQQEESSHQKRKNEEWEAKLNELNEALKSKIEHLEKELEKVNTKLLQELQKVVELEEDNEKLRKENLQLKGDKGALQSKVAEAEREKAEILRVKENAEKRNAELSTQLELQQKNEEIQRRAQEAAAQGAKEFYERELQERNRMIHSRETQLEEANTELQQAYAKIAMLEEYNQKLHKENLQVKKEKIQSLERRAQEQKAQEMTDSSVGSRHQSQGIHGSEKWRKIKDLGSGGYGDVYLAEEQSSHNLHAVKRITCKLTDTIEEQVANAVSFLTEIKVLQKYSKHARIVGYVDHFTTYKKDTIDFHIVMEYMPQGSLADVLKNGKLDDLKAREYTQQMLHGLCHLHANNIAHCDIKCANLLLDENGGIKLADFGCVKFLESSANSDPGTLRWMAPERVPMEERDEKAKREQNKEGAKKSDIWSVGVTVLEMLTGKKPFHSYKLTEIVSALGERKLPLDDFIYAPEHSDEAKEFLRMCLMWEPSKRATLQDLLSSTFCSV